MEKEKPLSKDKGFYGAGDEARTRYLHLGKVALYRMSYTRGTTEIIAEICNLSTPNLKFSLFLFIEPKLPKMIE